MTQQQMTARRHQTWECARTHTQTHRDTQTHWNGHSAKIVRCQQYAPCHVSVNSRTAMRHSRDAWHMTTQTKFVGREWQSCDVPTNKTSNVAHLRTKSMLRELPNWSHLGMGRNAFSENLKNSQKVPKNMVSARHLVGPPPVKPGEAPGVSQNTPAQQTKPWIPRSWVRRCRRSHSLVAVSRHGPG